MEGTKSKNNLIALLHFIRDCELDKPLGKCNEELVDACVMLLLKLQNKSTDLTAEQVEDKVRKIPFVISADLNGNAKDNTNKKTKKHTTRKKILLVAAIIALLAMLMGIGYSNSKDEDFFRNIVETIGIDEIVFGETYTKDGISYQENEYIEIYEDIKDYPEDNPYGILLPTYLPNNIELTSLVVSDVINKQRITIGCNSLSLSYFIYLDSKIPQVIIENSDEIITISNKTTYIVSKPAENLYQVYLEYNGSYYELNYTDKQELLKIIENMEE